MQVRGVTIISLWGHVSLQVFSLYEWVNYWTITSEQACLMLLTQCCRIWIVSSCRWMLSFWNGNALVQFTLTLLICVDVTRSKRLQFVIHFNYWNFKLGRNSSVSIYKLSVEFINLITLCIVACRFHFF